MLTLSRMRSIFFTEASLFGVFQMRRNGLSRIKLGQSSCRRREQQKPQKQKGFRQKAETQPGFHRPPAGRKGVGSGHFGRARKRRVPFMGDITHTRFTWGAAA